MESRIIPEIKLLMLGESGVGKTSLLLRFTEGRYVSDIKNSIGKVI